MLRQLLQTKAVCMLLHIFNNPPWGVCVTFGNMFAQALHLQLFVTWDFALFCNSAPCIYRNGFNLNQQINNQ